jgi:lipopolysaccharide export system permease protein
MWIIDRYLLRQFLETFFICFLSLTGLYIVFDAFTNLEEFLRAGEKQGALLSLMGAHYAYQALMFFDRTTGFLVLVSAMFTVTWIQRHNEMTALMSAGLSRVRVVRPVIVAAVALFLLAAVNRECVMPRFREQLARRPQDLVGDLARQMQPRYDNRTNILLRGKYTYADRQRIAQPDFLLPPALDQYGRQIVAEEASFLPARDGRPSGYLLTGVSKPADLATRPSLALDGRPVIVTPLDAPQWLQPNQCYVVSDVTFEQLTGSSGWRQFASTPELIVGLRNPSLDFGADVRVSIHSRLVQPLLDFTLLFLGLPLVLKRESRNVFIAIGMCTLVVALFMTVVIGFQHLGTNLLVSPAFAAWAPLILFGPLAVGMADAMWE